MCPLETLPRVGLFHSLCFTIFISLTHLCSKCTLRKRYLLSDSQTKQFPKLSKDRILENTVPTYAAPSDWLLPFSASLGSSTKPQRQAGIYSPVVYLTPQLESKVQCSLEQ